MSSTSRIAIIGGAASGVATLDQIILQAIQSKKQSSIQEIVIFEKGEQFGRGLAYGGASNSHILNMMNNTMSLRPDEPNHFADYLASNDNLSEEERKPQGYARRKTFGKYLQKNLLSALHKAATHNIKVSVKPHSDVSDVEFSDGTYYLSVSGKERQNFDKVILCVGNQPSFALSEFEGAKGYFSKPYDIKSITKNIPKEESITLVGSGLTAIDSYLALKEAGHEGHIRFVSRKGMLPKVRGIAEPYNLKFLSESNIAQLSHNGQRAVPLEVIKKLFLKELHNAGVGKDFIFNEEKAFNDLSAVKILERDLNAIGTQENTAYLSVLKSIDENIGYIWNTLSISDQKEFDVLYKRLWDAYDYPIPSTNAQKILQGLKSNDLSNLGDLTGITYNDQLGEYTVERLNGENFTTKYLVNATGQSFDIKRSKNLLLQNLQRYGFIQPHDLGGINVDFETGRAISADQSISNNLYIIGSLTRGVHFYTNSFGENAKAAQRTASDLVHSLPHAQTQLIKKEKLMPKPTKIALFIGSDVSSHLLLNRLIPEMKKAGYEPEVYLPTHRPSKKMPPQMLQDLGFYERRMTNEIIYPLLKQEGIQDGALNFSPEQLSSVYGVKVCEIENINAPAFVQQLKNDLNLKGGISVRCYQKFGEEIIDMFEQRGFLWNLHPGILPEYRGVMTLARAIANGEKQTSYSLHTIDRNWDAGPLLDIRPETLDTKRPMLSSYCDLAPSGVPMIVENITHFMKGTMPPEIPQDPEKAKYWTFPTPEELYKYSKGGIVLADPVDMGEIYIDAFKGDNEVFNYKLRASVNDAINEWESKKTRDSLPQSKPQQFTP